jgi:hypothetical protein
MTTQDSRLTRVLLQAVPAAGAADWSDVQRRAAGQRMAVRRRRLMAVAATAGMGALLAVAPATGIVGELRDLIEGTPAPPPVQTEIAKGDAFRQEIYARAKEAGRELRDRYSPVIASETRGVLAVDTIDGPIYLWVSPTEDGRQCWLIQAGQDETTGRPYGSGSCDGDNMPAISPGSFWTAERPSVKIIHVRLANDTITRVQVEVEGAANLTLPVVDGHTLGTIPKDAKATVLVGLDNDGNEIARFELSGQ